jgi:DNA-binding MarR family transcriptional regulator
MKNPGPRVSASGVIRLSSGTGQGKIRQMSNLALDASNVDLLRFFKALADETRLKMAALLAAKPRSGEQLADLLSIKPATVSHHLAKLADAGLVSSTSEGHKKFYALRLDAVRATAQQLQAKDPGLLVPEDTDTGKFYPNRVLFEEYDRKVLKDFFNSDGSLRQLPMQRKKFLVVLKHIVKDIEPGREYTEKQINALLKLRHPDTASLRRGLVDFRLMERQSGIYWRL